jgi:hypothetical protein
MGIFITTVVFLSWLSHYVWYKWKIKEHKLHKITFSQFIAFYNVDKSNWTMYVDYPLKYISKGKYTWILTLDNCCDIICFCFSYKDYLKYLVFQHRTNTPIYKENKKKSILSEKEQEVKELSSFIDHMKEKIKEDEAFANN